jgi:hypothetical protein
MKRYNIQKRYIFALVWLFSAFNGIPEVKAESTLQSTAVLNSYGANVPAGLIGANSTTQNVQLMDTRNGGVAHVSNAPLELLLGFSPDYREETVGKSGRTKLIVVSTYDVICRDTEKPSPTLKTLQNVQIDFNTVCGTITVISRQGEGYAVDASTIRYDVAAYCSSHYRGATIATRVEYLASSYGAAAKGSGTGLSGAISGVLSGMSMGMGSSLTSNSGNADLSPLLSITYLIIKP